MDEKKLNEAAENAVKEAKKVAGEVAKAAEPALAAAEQGLKAAAEKAEPMVKRARAAAKKAEPAVKAAAKSAKDAGKKVSAALSPEVYVEFGTRQYNCADIIERCRMDFKEKNKGAIRSCKVYIKPEDGVAYYVINKTEGRIPL